MMQLVTNNNQYFEQLFISITAFLQSLQLHFIRLTYTYTSHQTHRIKINMGTPSTVLQYMYLLLRTDLIPKT